MRFSDEEIQRYQRHFALRGFGQEAQAALKRGRVLVIGAGGLGCPALLYLSAAGVGQITVIDPDRVDMSNLQRQVLYTVADAQAHSPKAEAAAQRLREINPLISIHARVERFSQANALALATAHDVVLDASDNFATRYLANDACVLANRPLVYGAIHGFEGQVSVFNWQGGPTFRCLFPNPAPSGSIQNCADAGVLGVLPGLVGTVQATETIKLLTGIGEPLSGRLWICNALTMETRTLRVTRVPDAPAITELPPDEPEVCATDSAGAPCSEISANELKSLLSNPNHPVVLVDVREAWERERGAILPSIHMPVQRLAALDTASVRTLLDPAAHIVTYCASGIRSKRACGFLQTRHGYDHVQSLQGGYQNWTE